MRDMEKIILLIKDKHSFEICGLYLPKLVTLRLGEQYLKCIACIVRVKWAFIIIPLLNFACNYANIARRI
jgi:hypothetical protein